jgi:hypothetical protein
MQNYFALPRPPPPTTSNVEILGNFYFFYYLLVKVKNQKINKYLSRRCWNEKGITISTCYRVLIIYLFILKFPFKKKNILEDSIF